MAATTLSQEIETKLDTFFEQRKAVAAGEISQKKVTRYGAVNASGRLLRSLEVTKGPEPGQRKLMVNDYAYYLVKGRKPGTPPPVSPLIEWAKEKGLPEGIAFGIAKKIGQEGTTAYQQGGTDLFGDTTEQKALDEFMNSVAGVALEKVSSQLFEGFV